ncbi:MAG: WD40 repeat domain-containing protein [Kiritimatiellia bacterium]
MSVHAPFHAKDFSENAQSFLYACAFWAVAADQELNPPEQEWLVEQFGEAGATKSLDQFVALESSAFFEAFDGAAASLGDAEKRKIYPDLEEWLRSCITADETSAGSEETTIIKIKDRLSLDHEIAELKRSAGKTRTISIGRAAVLAGTDAKSTEAEKGRRKLTGHEGEVNAVPISPDGKQIVSGSDDGTVVMWEWNSGRKLWRSEFSEMGVTAAVFSPDGQNVYAADGLGFLAMWDAGSGEKKWGFELKRQGGITGMDISPQGDYLVVSVDIGRITVRGIKNSGETRTFSEKKWGSVLAVSFSSDGKLVASGGDDNAARIWDINGKLIKSLEGHGEGVTSVRFSPDGKRLVTGSRDNTLRLWNVETGETEQVFEGHNFSIYGVDVSSCGKYAASACWDHSVKIWDLSSGEELLNIESFDERFSCVRFHPHETSIAAGSSDKSVYILELEL